MKTSLLTTALLSLVATTSFGAAEMSHAVPADNQCRIQAKEIALQTYQTCVTETRTAKIEQIRKEYQEKISELKKQYETQILELKAANEPTSAKTPSTNQSPSAKVLPANTTPAANESSIKTAPVNLPATAKAPVNNPITPLKQPLKQVDVTDASNPVLAPIDAQPEELAPTKAISPIKPALDSAKLDSQSEVAAPAPTTTIDEAQPVENEPVQPTLKNDDVQSEELTLTQPTIRLKPAKKIELVSAKPTKKVAKPKVAKIAKKKAVQPIVAAKRSKGEKGVKGIARTLPVKQKPVETKPASQIITENELSKTAPIQESELEKVQLTQAPLEEVNQVTGQTENLEVVDQGLSGAQADVQGSSQQ